jgi:hypothetical protein
MLATTDVAEGEIAPLVVADQAETVADLVVFNLKSIAATKKICKKFVSNKKSSTFALAKRKRPLLVR